MFTYAYEVRFRRSDEDCPDAELLNFTIETDDPNDNLRGMIANLVSEYPDAVFDGMRVIVTPT